MKKTKFKIILLFPAILMMAGIGCQKIIHGYLSDRIFYQVNPFVVQQGETTVSAPLVTDGSTEPLHVKVLSLKDSLGNDADSILTTPRTIVTYTGTLTPNDSTLDLFHAKLKDSSVAPFNIAKIGGRLQFTAATAYVPAGSYNIDLQVSNVHGVRVLKNACQIQIVPISTIYSVEFTSFRINDSTGKIQLARYDNNNTYMTVDVNHESSSDETSNIIVKFVDKNGVAFNPAAGEVADWSNAPATTTFFPKLHMWAPYYPIKYTDSTIIQEIPNVNLSFPYFDLNSTYPAIGGARFDSRISNTSTNNIIHTAIYFTLYTLGTYYITVHLNTVVRK